MRSVEWAEFDANYVSVHEDVAKRFPEEYTAYFAGDRGPDYYGVLNHVWARHVRQRDLLKLKADRAKLDEQIRALEEKIRSTDEADKAASDLLCKPFP